MKKTITLRTLMALGFLTTSMLLQSAVPTCVCKINGQSNQKPPSGTIFQNNDCTKPIDGTTFKPAGFTCQNASTAPVAPKCACTINGQANQQPPSGTIFQNNDCTKPIDGTTFKPAGFTCQNAPTASASPTPNCVCSADGGETYAAPKSGISFGSTNGSPDCTKPEMKNPITGRMGTPLNYQCKAASSSTPPIGFPGIPTGGGSTTQPPVTPPAPPAPTPPSSATLTTTQSSITSGGSATLTATITGGTAPYTITWSDGFSQGGSSPLIRAVKPAATKTYSITKVTDAKNLSLGTLPSGVTIAVMLPPSSAILAAAQSSITSGDSTTLTATITGGKAPYAITWSDGTSQSGSSPLTRTVSPTATATYSLTKVTDANKLSLATLPAAVTVAVAPAMPAVGTTLSNPPGDYSTCSGCTTTYMGNNYVSLTCSCKPGSGSNLKATALIPYSYYKDITKVWNQNGQIAVTFSTLPGTTYLFGQVQ